MTAWAENEQEMLDQDEIIEQCDSCNTSFTMAYWDYELECYIYLMDEPLCPKCATVISKTQSTAASILE